MYTDYDDIPKNPIGYGLLSLVCGAVGTIIVFLFSDLSIVSAGLGAIGMVVGGFAISTASRFPLDGRVKYMAIAALGIMLSVISFMFGFVYFLT